MTDSRPDSISSTVPDEIRNIILSGLEDETVENIDGTIMFTRVENQIILHDEYGGIWAGMFTYATAALAAERIAMVREGVETAAEAEESGDINAMVEQLESGA